MNEPTTVVAAEAKPNCAPVPGSASRLWRVTLEFELVVEAKTEREAESLAEHHANQDGSGPSLTVATVLRKIEDTPDEWADSIPFGGDRNDERTCRERIASRSNAAGEPLPTCDSRKP